MSQDNDSGNTQTDVSSRCPKKQAGLVPTTFCFDDDLDPGNDGPETSNLIQQMSSKR